jgi:hypothetical protein
VVQKDPLQVMSLQGEVRQFYPKEKVETAKPKVGDFIKITYEPGPKEVNTFSAINILGETIEGKVKEIAADKSWIIISIQRPDGKFDLSLQTSKAFQPKVTAMQPGDGIRATYKEETGIKSVLALEWQYKVVGRFSCWVTLLGTAFILWLVAYWFTGGCASCLYLGADNRYSNSKFQTVLWFWMVISAYTAIVIQRIIASGWYYIGGVNIPQNLLILSGISVLSFTGAKVITTAKIEKAGGEAKPDAVGGPKASDLINDDLDRKDLGDFQMVVATFLAVILYAISTVEFMRHLEFRSMITMPEVDSTLLAIFGLSQAAYLGKKAAGDVMTSDQAIKAAADAAKAAKDAAGKATAANQTAQDNLKVIGTAATAASQAVTKTAAQTELDKANNAAKAAREKANEAAAAAQTAEARAGDVKKLADTWAKEPVAAAAIKTSLDDAQAAVTEANTAKKNAEDAAQKAKEEADKAKLEVDKKP